MTTDMALTRMNTPKNAELMLRHRPCTFFRADEEIALHFAAEVTPRPEDQVRLSCAFSKPPVFV